MFPRKDKHEYSSPAAFLIFFLVIIIVAVLGYSATKSDEEKLSPSDETSQVFPDEGATP